LIQIEVPGWRTLDLRHLVLDLNSVVAPEGEPITGVDDRGAVLSAQLAVLSWPKMLSAQVSADQPE
jgi:hypothetical protein